MKIDERREELYEGTIVFEDPAYDNSLIGITTDGRAVYDFESMVQEFATENNCSVDEAIDFVNYNTLRSLDYITGSGKPIVIDYWFDSSCPQTEEG